MLNTYICGSQSNYQNTVMQTNNFKSLSMGVLCALSLAGCMEKDLYQAPEEKTADEYFGFTTSSSCTVDLNYGLNYQVVFELYAENPLSEDKDGNIIKTKEEPVYRGATDKKGIFNDFISIPSYLTELYLYSDYLGTVSPIQLQITNGKVSFDQKAFIQSKRNAKGTSRGVTNSGYKYPEGFQILGEWNEIGCPTYLSSTPTEIDGQLMYNIREVFIKPGGSAAMEDYYPEYIDDNVNIEINIKKPTEIGLVMLSSTGTKQNTVGYFTYPTDQKPTDISQVTPIIAYPRISTAVCNSSSTAGSMYTGDRVELKYWDGTKFVNEFPAGVSIAWFLIESSYNQSTKEVLNNKRTFYSIRDLNKSKEHRTIALKNKSGEVVAFGMEDATNFEPTGDNTRKGNFGDAVFYLDFSDGSAIETGGVEELPDKSINDKEIYNSFKGVLSFEDFWASKGDYDMNDVMIRYKSKVYKSILTNRVYKIVDEFTPFHRGGYLINGFGYQLHNIANSDISDVSIEGPSYASKSQYMPGKTETGQSHPTILLFDNMRIFDGKEEADKKYTVTIQVNDVSSKNVLPPYNPFIFVESDKTRGREVHLVKYPPTDKANPSLLGTGKDVSRPDEGLYYVSIDLMPFALNMPISEFPIPEEGVRIDESYPKFATWVKSNGAQAKDWYKYPKK